MKSIKAAILLGVLTHPFHSVYAQQINLKQDQFLLENDANHPCISENEYKIIEARLATNSSALHLQNNKLAKANVTFSWPLKASSDLHDCSYYYISAYLDQNKAASATQDFNCGTNTYDGHGGTDISIWPFNFVKMDNNLVEIIAAASGKIIDKHDGEFDKNCGFNSLTTNYVVVEHSDGSRAMYWHMKKNSVTSKAIGQDVVVGELLGIVGSSGSSSGPHLHFEVWNGSTSAKRIDPFSGTCNTLNSTGWWTNQKPYKETAVIKVSVNTTDVVVPPCPATETANESNSYTIPFQGAALAPGYAKFYLFLRNEVSGMTADMSILNPDKTPFNSWTYTSTGNNKSLMWGFSKKLPTTPGKYTFNASYNGIICSKEFEIAAAAGIHLAKEIKQINVFPNPSSQVINIQCISIVNGEYQLELRDITGKTILTKTVQITDKILNQTLDVHSISKGTYWIYITNNQSNAVIKVALQ
jgi:hypothetical protein